MSEFADDAFTPASGKLGQLIYENPGKEIAPRLEFAIDIPFEAFEAEDEEVSTSLWLNGIRPDVKSWAELEGTSCETKVLYQVDGSVMLFGEMNPVEISKLEFGKISGQTIEVSIEAEIDFEQGAEPDYGLVPLNLQMSLAVDSLRIATSLDKRFKSDPAAIAAEIGDAADLSAYGELEKVPGGMAYPVKASA